MTLFLLIVALGLLGCERTVTVPALRGRVVDARTGDPISGAAFRTQTYRAGAASLEAPRLIRESDREAMTDEDGSFELPGFVDKEISGIGWLVYAQGYMVGSGCYSEEEWPAGGCSGFGLTDVTDPWVRTSWDRSPDGVDVELRLFPPTLEGVTFYTWVPERQQAEPIPENQLDKWYPNGLPDPWEEQFGRLSTLVQYHQLTAQDFVGEVEQVQLEDRRPTRRLIDAIRLVASSGTCDCDCAAQLLEVSEALCSSDPTLGCGPEVVARWRYLLDLRCSQPGR